MPEIPLVCETCGEALAVVDNTLVRPMLRVAQGVAVDSKGAVDCPGCGQATTINLNIIQKMIPSGPWSH